MTMQFRILVDGEELMQVRFVADAWSFVADRRSLGRKVEIVHLPTGRTFDRETADDVVAALYGGPEKRNP